MMGKLLDKWLHPHGKPARAGGIKSFREQQNKEAAFTGKDQGLRQVSLDQVVGSVGRYQDFDSQFRLRKSLPGDRFEKIKQMMMEGRAIPPVKLFQIKDEYYVLDGNHRVAAAKALGRTTIDARIMEFLPTTNSLENLLYREKADFRELTGLAPEIDLTELGQYAYLLRQIETHRKFLASAQEKSVTFKEAAEDWYRTIYRPLEAIVERSHLPAAFPKRTVADLYTYISFHQWEKGPRRKYGIGIDKLIPREMEAFREKMICMKEIELPEMNRLISAFVLMTVKAGREMRVMERLFEMQEVKEVHSVHGEFDILAKISMKRDLLSSDAEIIGNVVYEKVRRIPDVVATQTLIPSHSLQK